MDTKSHFQTNNIPSPVSAPPSGILQRKCASCSTHTIAGDKCDDCKNKNGILQRKSSVNSEHSEVPPIVHEVLQSSGQPLDKSTRAFFETRFARDFSRVPVSSTLPQLAHRSLKIGEPTDVYEQEADRLADSVLLKDRRENKNLPADERQAAKFDLSHVRIHTDARAAESARAVDALAYTVGNNIVFGAGRFAPETREGRRLISHELAHVVQQSRGGTPQPSFNGSGALEQAADKAAEQAVNGSGAVFVAGATAPSPMCRPDDKKLRRRSHDEESDEESETSPRRKDKERAQQRRKERAAAGKQDSDLTKSEAEQELRALERTYSRPGAKTRSLKRKENDLKRYENLLERAGGTQLDKNKRKGAFDELQRTPATTVGKPQTKHVAGGAQLPGQDLPAGEASYAQPDYTMDRRRKDGTLERVHVNLKSDKINVQTPAKARATARAYLQQAIKNSRHLADGESIIISFARTPTKEVQQAMQEELFTKGSPVGEVRFGTTTHKRADYKPPTPTPTPAEPSKTSKKAKSNRVSTKKGSTKKSAVKTSTPPVALKPKLPKTTPSAVVPPSPAKLPKATPPRAAVPSTPAKLPVTTPRATVPSAPVTRPKATPRIVLPGGGPRRLSRGSGGIGGVAAAEGIGALVEAIAVPIINHYLQEHYAESIEKEARELIAKAMEEHRSQFESLVNSKQAEIQKVQAEGREARLHVIVHTNWQDTDIGRVLTRAYVARYEIAYEDGPKPAPYKVPRPGGMVGDIFRDLVGVSFSYETFDITLEGTDPDVADQRLRRKLIETKMRLDTPDSAFEGLIISALENDIPVNDLRDYAAYRLELAQHSTGGSVMTDVTHWSAMLKLLDGPVEDVIAAAKAKNISLDMLRAAALYRARLYSIGLPLTNTAAMYWMEVVHLIDKK